MTEAHALTDVKRGCLKAWRLKKREPTRETMALGEELREHLTEYVAWKGQVGQPCGAGGALVQGKRGPLKPRGWHRANAYGLTPR